MLNYELNRAESILIVKPIGPLESADFEKLVQEVDPFIREKGKLTGLMIYAKSFPGWDNFASLPIPYKICQKPSSENQEDCGRNRQQFSIDHAAGCQLFCTGRSKAL